MIGIQMQLNGSKDKYMEINDQTKAYIRFCLKNGFQMDLDIDTMLKYITLTDKQCSELINIKNGRVD